MEEGEGSNERITVLSDGIAENKIPSAPATNIPPPTSNKPSNQ
jgi:hypothetical protein